MKEKIEKENASEVPEKSEMETQLGAFLNVEGLKNFVEFQDSKEEKEAAKETILRMLKDAEKEVGEAA